ncbi:hypothetical protein ACF0H5_021901 [Mactra antiquata]
MMDTPLDPPPEYYDIDNHHHHQQHMNNSIHNLDDKIREALNELDNAKQELTKVRSINKGIDKKIESAETERDAVQQKIDSLKTKLGVSNLSLNKCNDEKEAMRTKLNDAQVHVARLEERVSAASSELDRMRDPANPESNMSIKKHVANDKKEIKKLKTEMQNERNCLDLDNDTNKTKDADIKLFEKELASTKEMLKVCENERTEMLEQEVDERRQKEELVEAYRLLKLERKTFDQRLKDARIDLGVKTSGKNVNEKVMIDMKSREKKLTIQLGKYEKKLKDVTVDLEILKNQHKMSKTAMSINKYTKRTQISRGADPDKISLAQSGPGPVKFATKSEKEQTSVTSKSKGSDQGNGGPKDRLKAAKSGKLSDRSNDVSQTKRKGILVKDGPINGGSTNRSTKSLPSLSSKDTSPRLDPQGNLQKLQNGKKLEKRNSVQFVPQPKPKLSGNK